MTSPIAFPAHIIGLMSGTSADGVDAALLYTDGEKIAEAGESVFVPYSAQLRADILGLMQGKGDPAAIARALTEVHAEAVRALQKKLKSPADAVGFHGQTIRHAPHEGVTLQIGDAQWLADSLQLPVVFDFRTNDVAQGGQGAPLVPLYHAALAEKLTKPLMVVNIGGVANVTWIGQSSVVSRESLGKDAQDSQHTTHDSLLAFDCGPGNAMLDDWIASHTGARCDENGAIAGSGVIDEAAVGKFLQHPFFAKPVPKSLDRNQFSLELVSHHSLEDGAATLTAMTCAAIAKSMAFLSARPTQLLVTGGGRHNPTMMRVLQRYANEIPVRTVEAVGWQGDMLEAQAFAYLAARSLQALPLSLPMTTGVKEPVTGGKVCMPAHHHHDDDEDNTAPRSCCR